MSSSRQSNRVVAPKGYARERMRFGTRLRRVSCSRLVRVFFCVAVLCLSLFAQDAPPTEYQVKAAFLLSFAKFADWPSNTFSSPADHLRICVLGRDSFGNDLDQIVAGKAVNGHKAEVLRVETAAQARTCQMVFISSSQKSQLVPILQAMKSASTLTVGDTQGFAQLGVMINFVLDEGRVRFEVNLKAARLAHLTLSAKLLTVAISVIGKDEGGGN